ncbi:MAG: homocysteine S-methyltransferase family protein [Actinomycetia bacterium]|nr:homocysteine S-methyltransferase family protein [Actinomycetota bacterium]MCG2791689.1 homocysteine S-methyltransferase family protein [Actinomycetes bacterium]
MIKDNNINKIKLLDIIDKKILVSDGGMGTTLLSAGISEYPDSLNIDNNNIRKIIDTHLSFLEAGSDIIQTNTFGSTPIKLESFSLENEIKKINENAVNAAKEALSIYRSKSGDEKPLFIAGDIGPLGKLLEPVGTLKYEDAVSAFSKQAEILIGKKVDLIIIETIMDLNEALAAIEATRKISKDIPIACSLTFGENGVTLMGNKAEDVVEILINAGSDIVGANCSIGSAAMLNMVKKMREANAEARLIFQPNAGLPMLVEGKTIYNETPEIMASNIEKFLPYKPSIVGGCCGSTPEHIREIIKVVRSYNNP